MRGLWPWSPRPGSVWCPPCPAAPSPSLLSPTIGRAVEGSVVLRQSLPSLEACELFLQSGLELVCSVTGMRAPFERSHPVYLLVEVADGVDPTDHLAAVTASLVPAADTVVATDPSPRADLWRYREAHTEAINTLGAPHKMDVTLPVGSLAAFVDRVTERVRSLAPFARTWLFGHVGDGNIHVNVTGLAPDDDRVDEGVLGMVADFGGSIMVEEAITREGKSTHVGLHLSSARLSWTMVEIFLFILWIWLAIMVFVDIFRSHDMGGFAKAIWVLFIIILPFLGVFIYLIARGGGMHDRAAQQAAREQEAFDAYVRKTAGAGAGSADELTKLADLKAKGVITDAEFDEQKAKLLG